MNKNDLKVLGTTWHSKSTVNNTQTKITIVNLLDTTNAFPCVTAMHQVLTPEGWVNAESLKTGDTVIMKSTPDAQTIKLAVIGTTTQKPFRR
jgi:hypothetical protein